MLLSFLRKISFLFLALIVAAGLFWANKSRRAFSATLPPSEINFTQELTLNTPFDPNMQIAETNFPDRTCRVTDYGAIGDGKAKNTTSFRKAILDCAERGGGKVIVPAGVWLTGPIELLSNIDLVLEKNAEVRFSTDFSDYLPPVFGRFEGIEYYNFSPMVYANHAQNIAITGEGVLNGQGEAWWDFSWDSDIGHLYAMGKRDDPVTKRVFATAPKGLRPAFIEFANCNRVLMDGVKIVKGPMWTIHPLYSQNVILKNLDVNTAPGPSTDGIVIDSSKNVLADNITLATGDDAITIKSGRDTDGRRVDISSENIVLQNLNVIDAHGAVAIGSEMSADVRNVLAKNINIKDAQYAFRVKSNQQRGGAAENIWMKDVKVNSLSEALIQLNTDYEKGSVGYTDFSPTFKNIHFENIACSATKDSINIFGLSSDLDAINNLTFQNIKVDYSRHGPQIQNAKNIQLDNISVAPKYGPVYDVDNSENINISNSKCKSVNFKNDDTGCLSITGAASKNIRLDGNNFGTEKSSIQIGQKVAESAIRINQNH